MSACERMQLDPYLSAAQNSTPDGSGSPVQAWCPESVERKGREYTSTYKLWKGLQQLRKQDQQSTKINPYETERLLHRKRNLYSGKETTYRMEKKT